MLDKSTGVRSRFPVIFIVMISMVGFAISGTAGASTTESQTGGASAPAETEPAGKRSNSLLQGLSIHGFINQAFAISDPVEFDASVNERLSPTPEEIVLGIPDSGTTDYRNAALQIRYQLNRKHSVAVQLSHRKLGTSPISDEEDEIVLDWAAYELNLTDTARLVIGRVLMPFGIFNQIRDVGTLLPFFRPPFVFYREGSFTTETVDGVLFANSFDLGSESALELDVYAGGWDLVEQEIVGNAIGEVRAENGLGAAIWYQTPIPGLRIGTGGHRFTTEGKGGVSPFRLPGEKTTWKAWYASIEADFDRWLARAEYKALRFPFNFSASSFGLPTPPFPETFLTDVEHISYYLQLGFRITEKLSIYGQFENFKGSREGPRFTTGGNIPLRDDLGISLNYALKSQVVFKIEGHSGGGGGGVPGSASFSGGPGIGVRSFEDTKKGRYFIAGVSVAF